MASSPKFQHVPAPWKLKGKIYAFPMWSTNSAASSLSADKEFLYSALELNSSFSDGKFLGGLGMVQVVRYTESPVGPYDELLLIPGTFGYEEGGEKKKNLRITRIYVSQKETCWNGRTNWNIPKHLAKFDFTTLPNGALSIAAYPLEDGITQSPTPYFSAKFKPIPYLPSFPMSTNMAKYVGMDLDLAQPPLPGTDSVHGELPGTKRWCKIMPGEHGKASVGWWDLKQGNTEEDALLASEGQAEGSVIEEGKENWWPGGGRWRIGLVMEDVDIDFPEGRYWDVQKL